jgi:hypothetical protein
MDLDGAVDFAGEIDLRITRGGSPIAIPARRCDFCSDSSIGARASIGREFASDDLSGDTLNFYTRESLILRKRSSLLAREQLSRHPAIPSRITPKIPDRFAD